MKLTEREREVLKEMVLHHPQEWLRPMDLGGSDGSYHGGVLRRMVKKGLVEQKDRGSLAGIRAVSLYRITAKGLASIK